MRDQSFTDYFGTIYRHKKWQIYDGCPLSGPGSDPAYCDRFLKYFWRMMEQHNIQHVVNFGCGDCAMWGHDQLDSRFTCIDVVPEILEIAKQNQPRATFLLDQPIPPCDLILVKDVMIHWYDQEIADWFQQYRDHAPRMLIVERDIKWESNPAEFTRMPRDEYLKQYGWIPIDFNKITLDYSLVSLPDFAAKLFLIERKQNDIN